MEEDVRILLDDKEGRFTNSSFAPIVSHARLNTHQEGPMEGFFIDDVASRAVNQDRIPTHQRELRVPDKSPGALRQRAVQADHMAASEQLL